MRYLTTVTCAGRHLEEQDERLEKSLEVVNIVEAASDLDVLEEAHPEDGEDEHDEEEEEEDVEEGGHGHDEGEEEGADTLRTLYQPQNTTHLEDGQCKVKNGFFVTHIQTLPLPL